jgi:fructose-1,6-bisphosphatase/inositol monophosphatase family enzyme
MPPPSDALLDELLDVALAAASGAAELLAAGFGRAQAGVGTKSSPTDMVTEMDRAAERHIGEVLARRRPSDGVLGEEGTSLAGTTGVEWIVDPLDGTTNYLFGVPAYAVSVAASVDGRTVVGVVTDPSRRETWSAAAGRGARIDGRPIRLIPSARPLGEALVATGFSYRPQQRGHQAQVLTRVLPSVRDIRRFGAAAVDLCWVAAGRFDGYFESGLHPWDLAAGALIATEAGAEVTDLAGGPPVAGPMVVAAAPGLADGLRTLVADAVRQAGAE